MPSAYRKVLRDQRDLLLFRRVDLDLERYQAQYLGWGLLITWLAGVGRYWDHPSASLPQYMGLGSIVYVFVLALLIWGVAAPLKPKRWTYVHVLVFVMLTSLPALLYAIPVERFMTLPAAQLTNMLFLAVVAAWRVAMLLRFLITSAGLSGWATLVAGLLPLALIVTLLTFLNLERAVFDIMGGLREPTQYDAAYGVLVMITAVSWLASPVLLIAYAVLASRASRSERDA